MESAGVAELKVRLSEYLSRVKAGEEVLVTDRGKPVARLVPVGAGGEAGLDARRKFLSGEVLGHVGDNAPHLARTPLG